MGKDVFNDEVKTAVAEGYFFLADIFIAKEESMKKEKESAPGGWRGWRRLKLVEKTKETSIHTSFIFAPEDGGSVMRFQPGQYLSIRLPNIPGLKLFLTTKMILKICLFVEKLEKLKRFVYFYLS